MFAVMALSMASSGDVATDVTDNTVASVAQNAAEKSAQVLPHMPNTSDQIITILFALIAVIAMIYGIAWLAKRKQMVTGTGRLPMKTLAIMPMGVKEKIVLVQVGEQQLLLGLTAHSINTLATFDEPIMQEGDANIPEFAQRLKQVFSNKGLNLNGFNQPKKRGDNDDD
ncbi:flagellar biosynthetic protein FliO [Bermanella marisrubri]|uniref:Flagellar protein n=1 Tax=Bermanella marisrubri TaxID=207949 RepID=Q1N2V4_9GAMM|nr:flagellar biosynthetic protein FliO [Bermanella marisrubri]EAT12565.1 Flagellar biogenesis protein [Oceanobacter sp. RED65] [Bermanella marisrubri]QIZ84878.1 flagellar biosynthetic protein FliO [Bermanella marisrubri]